MRPAFLLLFAFISIASASDVPLYNFGTMQDGMELNATAGETVSLSIYFFMDEVYGNQVSHILLSPGNLREPWEVEFDPPAHTAMVEVGDTWVSITENIQVEPRPVLPEIPDPQEDGIVYLESPSGLGYLQAKKVEARLKIPENIPTGFYHVVLSAKAEYFGQSGAVAITQSRNFGYWINVTGVSPTPIPTPTPEETPTPATTPIETQTPIPTPQAQEEPGIDALLLPIGAVLAIGAIVLIIFYFTKKGKK